MECTALSLCTHIYLIQAIILKYVRSLNISYKHFIRGTTEATHVKSQTVKTNIHIYMCIFHKKYRNITSKVM